ncbi:MAG TPA: DUF1592 domain-containing protein [Opitutaceae bacterium]|nr:DUF1592 domain-containing protein [Opitutaceae bacterium]
MSRAKPFIWTGLAVSAGGLALLLASCMRSSVSTPAPQKLAAAAPTPAARPATPWEEYHKTVQPFLKAHCYECHGDDNAENNFRLDLIHDDASLEDGSRTLEKAFEKLSAHKMPPSDEPQPAAAEVAPVLSWLQLHLVGDPNAPINPGRVTLHRLNRAEYNNTVRDLLGIDFRPADAFPVDDAGYGFDNNGDVLSLAPVLLEKYLTAANLSLDKAILADPVLPPPVQHWEAATLEGNFPKSDAKAALGNNDANTGGGKGRPIPIGRVFNANGEIFADYDIPADGEYVLRIRAYGTQGAVTKQRPSVAFLVDGKQVQQPFSVKEDIRNTSSYAVDKTALTAGRHRISLAFLNGATPEEAAGAAANAGKKPAASAKPAIEVAAKEAAADADNAADAAADADNAAPAEKPAAAKADRPKADAAVAAAVAEADKPAAPAAGRAGANGRGRAGAAGARGAAAAAKGGIPQGGGRQAGPPPSPTGKPTLGVIYVELEGPLAPTPDRMPESYRRVMIAQPSPLLSKPAAAEKIIRHFASRAYRRPVQEDEVTRLMAVWAKADSDGRPFDQSIDLVLQAVMVSPAFLFRMEQEPQPGEGNVHTLNEYELASRLSYFLWSSMPDDELFALAQQGRLRANLDAQVKRMLKDPKSAALVENFAGQWLQLRSMQNVTPDTKRYPAFDQPLREAMTKETQLFFNAIVQEDRSVLDFIDADFTFVNERLARHYGIPGITGNEFQRVTLPPGQRGGLITQASILTITSYPGRTSPVQRGKWVLENLLDSAPPPPPPNVPALAEGGDKELTGTLRQRMEQHRANPTCAACHERMDGIGFALENFDGIGSWRTVDANNEKIDAAGTLPGGKSFNGPAELREIIKSQSDQFCRCLAGKMLTYGLGRGLESYDSRTTDAIAAAMKQNGDRFSAMVEEIVRSDAFQKRNGKIKRGDS